MHAPWLRVELEDAFCFNSVSLWFRESIAEATIVDVATFLTSTNPVEKYQRFSDKLNFTFIILSFL